MIKLYQFDELRPEEILNRDIRAEKNVEDVVDGILADVRARGDAALKEYALKFDGASIEELQVTQAEIDEAFANMDPYFLETLKEAAANIEAFHRAQLPQEVRIETMPGVRCMQRAVPIRRVGLYVPGGQAPLFSTMFSFAARSRISPSREIPFPNMISNSASLNGGAILFFTTFTRTRFPTTSPPCFNVSILRTSIRTEE